VLGPGSAELRLDGGRLLVRPAGEDEREVTDSGGTLARWLGAAGATALRIRPDRVVASAT
jgi:hypothetical protein